jgi:hypothetical protein
MQVISTVSVEGSILDQAELALVEGATKTGDLINAYAMAMCEVFDVRDSNGELVCKWFELVGKDKKGVNARRASFVQRMVARGHVKVGTTDKPSATVDTYWARVKEASGYVPRGRVSGTTDVDAKTMSELKTIINRILKAEEAGESPIASNFREQLTEIFEELGGDKGTLGK